MLANFQDVLQTTLEEFVEKISHRCSNFDLYVDRSVDCFGHKSYYVYAFRIRGGEIDNYGDFKDIKDFYLLPELSEEHDITSFFEHKLHVGIDGTKERKWLRELKEIAIHGILPSSAAAENIDGPLLKPTYGYNKWNLKPIIPTVVNIGDPVFKCNYNPNPCYDPEKIILNDPATIIIWRDGSKTVVKCQNGEPYDPEKGIAMCYMKKANGNKPKYYDIFKTGEKKGVIKYGERKDV